MEIFPSEEINEKSLITLRMGEEERDGKTYYKVHFFGDSIKKFYLILKEDFNKVKQCTSKPQKAITPELIINSRENDEGKEEFLIKYKDESDLKNTWEIEEDIDADILHNFNENFKGDLEYNFDDSLKLTFYKKGNNQLLLNNIYAINRMYLYFKTKTFFTNISDFSGEEIAAFFQILHDKEGLKKFAIVTQTRTQLDPTRIPFLKYTNAKIIVFNGPNQKQNTYIYEQYYNNDPDEFTVFIIPMATESSNVFTIINTVNIQFVGLTLSDKARDLSQEYCDFMFLNQKIVEENTEFESRVGRNIVYYANYPLYQLIETYFFNSPSQSKILYKILMQPHIISSSLMNDIQPDNNEFIPFLELNKTNLIETIIDCPLTEQQQILIAKFFRNHKFDITPENNSYILNTISKILVHPRVDEVVKDNQFNSSMKLVMIQKLLVYLLSKDHSVIIYTHNQKIVDFLSSVAKYRELEYVTITPNISKNNRKQLFSNFQQKIGPRLLLICESAIRENDKTIADDIIIIDTMLKSDFDLNVLSRFLANDSGHVYRLICSQSFEMNYFLDTKSIEHFTEFSIILSTYTNVEEINPEKIQYFSNESIETILEKSATRVFTKQGIREKQKAPIKFPIKQYSHDQLEQETGWFNSEIDDLLLVSDVYKHQSRLFPTLKNLPPPFDPDKLLFKRLITEEEEYEYEYEYEEEEEEEEEQDEEKPQISSKEAKKIEKEIEQQKAIEEIYSNGEIPEPKKEVKEYDFKDLEGDILLFTKEQLKPNEDLFKENEQDLEYFSQENFRTIIFHLLNFGLSKYDQIKEIKDGLLCSIAIVKWCYDYCDEYYPTLKEQLDSLYEEHKENYEPFEQLIKDFYYDRVVSLARYFLPRFELLAVVYHTKQNNIKIPSQSLNNMNIPNWDTAMDTTLFTNCWRLGFDKIDSSLEEIHFEVLVYRISLLCEFIENQLHSDYTIKDINLNSFVPPLIHKITYKNICSFAYLNASSVVKDMLKLSSDTIDYLISNLVCTCHFPNRQFCFPLKPLEKKHLLFCMQTSQLLLDILDDNNYPQPDDDNEIQSGINTINDIPLLEEKKTFLECFLEMDRYPKFYHPIHQFIPPQYRSPDDVYHLVSQTVREIADYLPKLTRKLTERCKLHQFTDEETEKINKIAKEMNQFNTILVVTNMYFTVQKKGERFYKYPLELFMETLMIDNFQIPLSKSFTRITKDGTKLFSRTEDVKQFEKVLNEFYNFRIKMREKLKNKKLNPNQKTIASRPSRTPIAQQLKKADQKKAAQSNPQKKVIVESHAPKKATKKTNISYDLDYDFDEDYEPYSSDYESESDTPTRPPKKIVHTGGPLTLPDGKVATFPLEIGTTLRILSLGEVCPQNGYFTDKYLYNPGFVSEKLYYNMHDPDERIWYTSSIVKTSRGPKFIVENTQNKIHFESEKPSGAWVAVIRAYAAALNKISPSRRATTTVSGPEYFGISAPIVRHLFSQMENVEKCRDFTTFTAPVSALNACRPGTSFAPRMRRPPLRSQRRSHSSAYYETTKSMSTRADWIGRTVAANEWAIEFPIAPFKEYEEYPSLSFQFPDEAFEGEDQETSLSFSFDKTITPNDFLSKLNDNNFL